MRINNNLMAMNTHRQLGMGSSAGAKSMEKLSSGYRINRAGDD
ncbi:MAG: flagellin, partial [Clostridiaceae bacterium]|nr:flagellin [Clostridiaceae bacterium]